MPILPPWTQVIGTRQYRFQNPLRQNYKHVKAVQQVLDFVPAKHIHSLVVFTGDAKFTTERPQGVCDVLGSVQHITRYTGTVLTAQRLQWCVGRLECLRKRLSGQTDVEHHAYLQRKFGDIT